MTRATIFAITLLVVCALVSGSCYRRCEFYFCDRHSEIHIGVPDKALSGPICKRGNKVGIINSGEARLVLNHFGFVPISKFPLGKRTQKFSPSFFKTFAIGSNYKFSGVGHEVPQQNQIDFLKGKKCWILPITAYQVLGAKHNVVNNVHPSKFKTSCIAFTTKY